MDPKKCFNCGSSVFYCVDSLRVWFRCRRCNAASKNEANSERFRNDRQAFLGEHAASRAAQRKELVR